MRLPVAVISLVITVAGLGPAAPTTASHPCDQTLLYRYCGDHPVGLPLRLRVIMSGSPVGAVAMREAVERAVHGWNAAWMEAAAAAGAPWLSQSDPACPAICIDATGSSTVGWRNGLGGTCSEAADAIAVACLARAAGSGHAAHHIVRVDVILNSARLWRAASGPDLVTGEIEAFGSVHIGNDPLLCPVPWWDVWSVVAHELGHALGLDDLPGNWPANLSHVVSARQTMYVPGSACTTNRRTLEEGDLLGLRLAAADSAKDR